MRTSWNAPQTSCVNDAWPGWARLAKPDWGPCCPGLVCDVGAAAAARPYGYCVAPQGAASKKAG